MSKRTKVHAIYTGRVQGVGFRNTVLDLSVQFPVTGTVCNVSDGSVELTAVGLSHDLIEFTRAIDQRLARNIENCQLDWQEAVDGEFTEFTIGPDRYRQCR